MEELRAWRGRRKGREEEGGEQDRNVDYGRKKNKRQTTYIGSVESVVGVLHIAKTVLDIEEMGLVEVLFLQGGESQRERRRSEMRKKKKMAKQKKRKI
jgi:hypothetical protein